MIFITLTASGSLESFFAGGTAFGLIIGRLNGMDVRGMGRRAVVHRVLHRARARLLTLLRFQGG